MIVWIHQMQIKLPYEHGFPKETFGLQKVSSIGADGTSAILQFQDFFGWVFGDLNFRWVQHAQLVNTRKKHELGELWGSV